MVEVFHARHRFKTSNNQMGKNKVYTYYFSLYIILRLLFFCESALFWQTGLVAGLPIFSFFPYLVINLDVLGKDF